MISTWCNGRWHIDYKFGYDLALRRAQGVIEVLERRGGVFFHWEEHYERLMRSCAARPSVNLLKLPPRDHIEKKLSELAVVSSHCDLVWIEVTPGNSWDTKTPIGFPTLSIEFLPLPAFPSRPFKLKTVRAKRDFSQYKFTAGYGYSDMYEAQVKAQGFDKFLYWTPDDGVLEGAYENLFLVRGDALLTPCFGMLPGITREIVLNIAKSSGIFGRVAERVMHLSDVEKSTEAFVTSTTLHIAPVKQIDNYDHFKVGPDTRTAELSELFLAHREKYFSERGA